MPKKRTATRPPVLRRRPVEADAGPYYSRAISKAIDTIEYLASQSEPVPLHVVAAKLKLVKSSALRILTTLEGKGILQKNDDLCYSIRPESRAIVPASSVRKLERAAEDPMRDLLMAFRETVSLAALFTNHVEVIAVLESPEIIRMSNTPGRILPPHASSLGKAIAAFLDEQEQRSLVNSYGITSFTHATITDDRMLRDEYDTIRKQGFSQDREETVPDGNCFGAPIFDEHGRPVGSISLSMPKARLEARGGEIAVIDAVLETARRISRAYQQ